MCSAQYGCFFFLFFFCSSFISCFPGMLLRYCLSDFEITTTTRITTNLVPLQELPHICDKR